MHYKHTQPGYVTGLSLVAGAALTYFSFRSDGGTVDGFGLTMTGSLLAGAVLFSSLTTVVTDEELRFYFGPGFWMRRFALDDIEAAEPVRNSAWYGWGIRYTPHGWLYNVSGLRAVELTVRGEGQLRIGTDEPEKLKRAVDRTREPA